MTPFSDKYDEERGSFEDDKPQNIYGRHDRAGKVETCFINWGYYTHIHMNDLIIDWKQMEKLVFLFEKRTVTNYR